MMIVKVTSKHITAAKKSIKKNAITGCMVAVALNSKRNVSGAHVGFESVSYSIGDKDISTHLPEFVTKNIEQFTAWVNNKGKRPESFQFEISDGN